MKGNILRIFNENKSFFCRLFLQNAFACLQIFGKLPISKMPFQYEQGVADQGPSEPLSRE